MDRQVVEMVAGFGSSLIFMLSNFPMVAKVLRRRDLKSYSFSQILMANLGNFLYWFYVAGLPLGPVWFLHGFNTAVALLMLTLYLRFETHPGEALRRLAFGKAAGRLTAVSLLLNQISQK